AHVHFDRAGALINDANLMTVSDEAGLRREVGRVAGRLEPGEWITEGLWGAYEQWDLGDEGGGGRREKAAWRPRKAMIDDLTPENPCFLCRYDLKEWLANSAALKAAELGGKKMEGLELGRDGKPTGIIFRPSLAFEAVSKAVLPKSRQRLLDENRAALKALREAGVVEVHDIEDPGSATAPSRAISTASWVPTAPSSSSPMRMNPRIAGIGGITPPTIPISRPETWIRCTA
ncbi:MAG: hypothetical protein H6P98_1060, partial [Candidatus Aminicenantes bacterium]|nr:hypothetical protein [Candidatus Aminicenantes bacterium]